MASGGMNKRTNMFCRLPMSLNMDNASDVIPKGRADDEWGSPTVSKSVIRCFR